MYKSQDNTTITHSSTAGLAPYAPAAPSSQPAVLRPANQLIPVYGPNNGVNIGGYTKRMNDFGYASMSNAYGTSCTPKFIVRSCGK